MSHEHSGHGVRFWVTVGIVAVLFYPLSAGPAAWLLVHALPESAVGPVDRFYAPVVWATNLSQPTRDAWHWYIFRWVTMEELLQLRTDVPVPAVRASPGH